MFSFEATGMHNVNLFKFLVNFLISKFSKICSNFCQIYSKMYTYGGSKQFPALSKTWRLMGHYYYSLSVDATIIVSKNCPFIGEHVGIIFVTQ